MYKPIPVEMRAVAWILVVAFCCLLVCEAVFDLGEAQKNTYSLQFAFEPMQNPENAPTVPMINTYGQQFSCLAQGKPQGTAPNATAVLESMSNECYEYNGDGGWWRYYVCIGIKIEQSHVEKINGVIHVASKHSLGVYAGESEPGVQQFVNGSQCDTAAGSVARTAVLRARCGRRPGIAIVIETSSCAYDVVFQTPELCPATPSHTITCHARESSPEAIASAMPLRAGQRWDGVYTCQGTQRVSIIVYDTKEIPGGTEARAVCAFAHTHASHWGAFECTLVKRGAAMSMAPSRWVRRPLHYATVAYHGALDGSTWSGVVPQCANAPFRIIGSESDVPADLSSLPPVLHPDDQPWRRATLRCFSAECSDVCPRDIGPYSPACLAYLWQLAGCSPEGAFAPSHPDVPAAQLAYWNGLVLLDVYGDMRHVRTAALPTTDHFRRCFDASTVPAPPSTSSVPPTVTTKGSRSGNPFYKSKPKVVFMTADGDSVAAAELVRKALSLAKGEEEHQGDTPASASAPKFVRIPLFGDINNGHASVNSDEHAAHSTDDDDHDVDDETLDKDLTKLAQELGKLVLLQQRREESAGTSDDTDDERSRQHGSLGDYIRRATLFNTQTAGASSHSKKKESGFGDDGSSSMGSDDGGDDGDGDMEAMFSESDLEELAAHFEGKLSTIAEEIAEELFAEMNHESLATATSSDAEDDEREHSSSSRLKRRAQ